MPKLLLPLAFLLITTTTIAQDRTRDFEITLPEQKVSNSLYNKITCIDGRYDTSFMGVVQLGLLNAKTKVVPRIPFPTQVENIMSSLVDSTAQQGELLLHLRQLSFAELTGSFSEKGYCYFRADLYARNQEQYQKISSIDTVLLVKAVDVTKALFRRGSKMITDLIQGSLLIRPTGSTSLSYADVTHIDDIEKKDIPVFNTTQYKDGLYLTYHSFFAQIPDGVIKVEKKKEKISSVKSPDSTGNYEKVKAKNIYAIVHEGQPFIATDYGYYPIRKENNDLLFTGKSKVTADAGDVIAAGAFFGIIGSLLAANSSSIFEMKIDHLNGGFIRLKEITTPVE